MDGWFNTVGLGYITENAYGNIVNTYPVPDIRELGREYPEQHEYDTFKFIAAAEKFLRQFSFLFEELFH